MVTRTAKAALAGITVLAVVGVGSGFAYATDGDNPPPPGNGGNVAPGPHPAGGKHHRGLLGRVEHGEFTVRAKDGTRVLDVQRGAVTAVDGQSITVRSADGFSGTYTIDPQTKVRKDRKAVAIDQVTTNDRVVVVAEKNGSTALAKRIGDRGPAR